MFKRTWIMVISALVLAVLLSACKGGKLAKDLTPIPTLPKGAEPTLVSGLQETTPATQTGGQANQDQLVATGEQLFSQNGCQVCHGAQDGVGPAFTGMAARAASRVAGMTAEDYLRESIINPSAYVVPGFKDNIMPKNFGQALDANQVNALIAYIVAKSGGEAAAPATSAPTTQPTAQPTTAEVTQAATPAPTASEATQAPTAAATTAPTAAPTAAATTAPAAGDPAAGQKLFAEKCSACHADQDGVAPGRIGMGQRAATRIAGMSAADYLHQSIVDPGAFVVPNFKNIMPTTFSQQLTDQEINDLVAYLLTQ